MWYEDHSLLCYSRKLRLTTWRQVTQNHIVIEGRIETSIQVFFLLKHHSFYCVSLSNPKWQILLSFSSFFSLSVSFLSSWLPSHPLLSSLRVILLALLLVAPLNRHPPVPPSPCAFPGNKLKYWFHILEFRGLQNLVLVRVTPCFKISVNIQTDFLTGAWIWYTHSCSHLLLPSYPFLAITTLISCHSSLEGPIPPVTNSS